MTKPAMPGSSMGSHAAPSKPKTAATVPISNVPAHGITASLPLSARRSDPLDLRTVERRGQLNAAPEISRPNRIHGITEAPSFRPTEEEFKDPMEYMRKIAPEGRKYGIIKIIPPDGWNPTLAIDTTVSRARLPSKYRQVALRIAAGVESLF